MSDGGLHMKCQYDAFGCTLDFTVFFNGIFKIPGLFEGNLLLFCGSHETSAIYFAHNMGHYSCIIL